MPQSWSPPLPPGVSRRQGISRSQLLSSWSRVWIYMLAGRAPHKSKLVVWALSGPGPGQPAQSCCWPGYTGIGRAAPPGHGASLVSFTVASSAGTDNSNQWSASRPEVSSHQLVVSDNLWGHCSDTQRDLHGPRVLSGNGDIKRWDPLTQW